MIFWNFRDNFENKVERAIWHYLKQLVFTSVNILKTMSLKHLLWLYLKRFGTAMKQMKTMSLKYAFWRYLKRFGTAENILKTFSLKHAL